MGTKQTKLKFQYGLELTWHDRLERGYAENGRSKDEVFYYKITEGLKEAFKKYRRRRGEAELYRDADYTAEFKSPRLKSLEEIKEYYLHCASIARKQKWPLTGKNWISGGGHLHLLTNATKDLQFVTHVLEDACNRPYLSWVFSEPEQDDHSCPVLRLPCVKKPEDWGRCTGKSTTVHRTYKDSFELRFFEAPKNWREQELHILFADKWLSHLLKQYKAGEKVVVVPRTKEELQKLPFDWCVSEFNALLKEIGLNPDDYAHFIKRNLKVRCDNKWVKN